MTAAINTKSPVFNWVTAQFAHFGWGALITLAFAYFNRPIPGVLAVLAWSTLKEFVVDKYLEKQPFLANLTDWAFYEFGSALALLLAVKHGA
jgi:hypothetical protein